MTTLLHRLKHALAGYDFAPPLPSIPEFTDNIAHLTPAATLLTHQDRLVSPFTPAGNIALPLTRGRVLRFQLTPYDCDELIGLRLRVMTYARVNHTHLSIRIQGHIHRINVRDFVDQTYFHIHFTQPLPCISAEPLEIELFSDDADEHNCVAVACTRKIPPFRNSLDLTSLHFDDSTPPRVSIVIPVYNKVLYTDNCLRSVQQCDSEISKEIIVINNNSSDETETLLAQLTGAVKVVNNADNKGFVGACRQGADLATGEFILFLNNDTQVLPDWLNSLVRVMDADAQVGIVGSKLIYPDGRLQEAGGIIFSDASGCNYGREQDPTLSYFNISRAVDYCSGASLMICRHLWEQLGGFDQRYAPAYYEDTDLCFAAREAGYKVWYCHESEVIHHEGITAGTDINSGYKAYQAINREKFIAKWLAVLTAKHCPPGTDADVAIRRLSVE